MKKSLIFWFAAVTCAALFLVGCEQGTGGDGAAGAAGKTIVPVSGTVADDLFQAAIDASDGIIAGNVTITGASPIVLPSNKTLQLVGTITLPDDGVFVVVGADSLSGPGGFEGTSSGNPSYLIAPPAVTAARNSGTDLTSVSLQAFGTDFDNAGSVLGVQGDLAITDTAGAAKIATKTVYVTGNVTVSNAASPTAIIALGNVSASATITGAVAATGKVTFSAAAQTALTGLTAGSVESAVAITTTGTGAIDVKGELKTTGATSHVTLGGAGTITAGSLDLAGNLAAATGTAVTVKGAAKITGTLSNGAAATVFTFDGPTTVTGQFTPGAANTEIAGKGAVTFTAALGDTSANTVIIKNTGGVTLTAENTIADNVVATNVTIIGGNTGVTIKSDGTALTVNSNESIIVPPTGGSIVAGASTDTVTITGATLKPGTYTGAATGLSTIGEIEVAGAGKIDIAGNGDLALTAAATKVVLLAGATIDVKAATGKFGEATQTNTKVTVGTAAAPTTPTKATVENSGTTWTVTTDITGTNISAVGKRIFLGAFALDFDGTNDVEEDACIASTANEGTAAAGKIVAGTGTAITFIGTDG